MNIANATPELFAALAAAQAEVENASKTSKNDHFRSRYADLAEVLNTVRPVFAKHGIAILQSTSFEPDLVSVTTVLAHASGGSVSSVASCVPAKVDAQGIGSATTYLRRYGLAAMAGVAQEDDDGIAAAHDKRSAQKPVPRINQSQVDSLINWIDVTQTDLAQFAAWLGVEDIANLPEADYPRALAALQRKAQKQADQTNASEAV